MLHLWNTRSRALEAFVPLRPPRVGLYTCGPTVYNTPTLGNWRAFLFDDVLARVLRFSGYEVDHVMNITDIGHLAGDGDEGEDKVEREAKRRGVTALQLARTLEDEFLRDLDSLHILRPTRLPRATEHVPEQIALVQRLETAGYAYRTSDGIYFDTAKFAAYGALSGQTLAEKKAGARVEENLEKRHPTDFALWKFSAVPGTRQMEWESPWGTGFPGWHIECSAMATKYLGQPFDIHCGGVDHIPVHHENEIAQSEAVDGTPLAKYWLHNEFLLIDGGRMGKSLGNAYTVDDLHAHGFDPVAYRYFTLGAHYRSKLNFTWEALEGSKQALDGLKRKFLAWEAGPVAPDVGTMQAFRDALDEDLNTPKALAVVWELAKASLPDTIKRATLLAMDAVLGLGVAEWREEVVDIPLEIRALAESRKAAREARDWPESDRLRIRLEEAGWQIIDTKDTYALLKHDRHG